jgi:hypothetical protein
MAELKAAKQQQRFGSVRDIGRADFVREVSNAGADVHVVVHLHQDGCVAPLTKVTNGCSALRSSWHVSGRELARAD